MSIFGIIYAYGLLVMHKLTVYNINIYVGLTRQHVYTCAFACVYNIYISTTFYYMVRVKQHLPKKLRTLYASHRISGHQWRPLKLTPPRHLWIDMMYPLRKQSPMQRHLNERSKLWNSTHPTKGADSWRGLVHQQMILFDEFLLVSP